MLAVQREKELDPGLIESRLSTRVLIAASVVSWVLVLWVFNAARYLRPVADDYCIGVRADLGPIGGFVNDFLTWSGFVTPSFLTNLFVGIPLANGPLWFASSITFVLAGISIAFLVATVFGLIGGFDNGFKTWFIRAFLIAPLALVSWWTFLWFPLEMSTDSPMDELAIGLTHWQNLNSAYVIPTALILGAALLLLRDSLKRTWWVTLLSVVLGLVTGLMGPTFGLAALLTLVLLAIWIAQHDSEGKRRKLLDLLFAGLGVVVGLGIAYLSPGTQARASIFESNEVTFAPDSLVGWIMGIIPENFTMFGELLFHWGSLILIVLFVGLGFLATRKFMDLKTEKVLPIAIGLATFGVALTSATIVTDALSYGAYWHSSSIAVVAYGVCASVGFWAGGLLARQGFESAVLVASFALLVGLTGGIGSSLDLSTSIVEREAAWRDGPAPIKGIIEDREVDWIGNCAVQLEEVNPTFS